MRSVLMGLYCVNVRGKMDTVGTNNTGENLDAVTAVTDSFKMADAFTGDRTGGAVAQTNAQRVDISVWQDRVWVNRLQKIYGPGWRRGWSES